MMVIAVDYDGTLFEKTWPELGKPNMDVINKVKEFSNLGAQIVLWTCREGKSLQEALARCHEQELYFDSVNENSPFTKDYLSKELKETGDMPATRKVLADIYVDDKSPGSIDFFLNLNPKEECNKY